mmetsp:Transcript_28074/g.63495  ORF Transcript_28074/g.63495 Transcript_28074/m.63495 type:complete len:234 (+) Transcript_28074:308-1009(+)
MSRQVVLDDGAEHLLDRLVDARGLRKELVDVRGPLARFAVEGVPPPLVEARGHKPGDADPLVLARLSEELVMDDGGDAASEEQDAAEGFLVVLAAGAFNGHLHCCNLTAMRYCVTSSVTILEVALLFHFLPFLVESLDVSAQKGRGFPSYLQPEHEQNGNHGEVGEGDQDQYVTDILVAIPVHHRIDRVEQLRGTSIDKHPKDEILLVVAQEEGLEQPSEDCDNNPDKKARLQ